MRLEYSGFKDESSFILTDFSYDMSQNLLQHNGLYKIIWSKERTVSFMVDGYKIQLKKNQIIFCTPLNMLVLPQIKGIMAIMFNREFYCIRDHDKEVSCEGFLFFGSSQAPIVTLNKKYAECFESMFHVLEEEFEEKDHIQGEMLRVLLKRLLIKSSRLAKKDFLNPDMPSTQLDVIRKYHVLVEKHFRKKHQVSDYAEMLNKSPKTLSNLFKKMGAATPLMAINERIVLEAKRLLLYSTKTAEEIAFDVGFNDAAHFSKFFKNQVGVPPVKFRSQRLAS